MSGLALHLAFGFGGGLGALARHALTFWITHRFPLSTLLVNGLGSFTLGVALAYLPTLPVDKQGRERKSMRDPERQRMAGK
ncbi:MAG: CrcB family protein, partial [Pseudomonadota bacterium]